METDKASEDISRYALKNGVLIKPAGNEKNKALFLLSVSGFNIDDTDDMLRSIKDIYEKSR